LVWFGLVWFGLVWFGLVWFGLVWFGLVWFGLVWFDDLIIRGRDSLFNRVFIHLHKLFYILNTPLAARAVLTIMPVLSLFMQL
jgi:hypothetical protein